MKNERGKGQDIRDRATRYGQAVVSLHRRLYRAEPDLREVSRQSVKAGTAIGALLEEAEAAQSKADFVSKLGISLKEARESRYWLRVLYKECKDERPTLTKLGKEVTQIIAIVTTIVKNARHE